MRTCIRRVGLAVVFISITSCDQILVQQPTPTGLAGIYTLTSDAVDFLKARKGYRDIPEATLELRADGTLLVKNLPDCVVKDFGDSGGTFLSGHGRWAVEKDFLGYGLAWVISPGGTLPEGGYSGPWVAIRRRSPPYELELTIGDPDSGERIRYHR
jgi:hypothetical protein